MKQEGRAELQPSRRGALRAGVVALLLFSPAVRLGAQSFDPLALWRMLRARRLATANASKAVRAKDARSGRAATLRLVTDGGPGVAMMIRLGDGPRLDAHTVIARNAEGETFALEPLPPSQTQTSEGEWVVVALELRHLDTLCAAESAVVTVRGWDEALTLELGAKDVSKLRAFRDRLGRD